MSMHVNNIIYICTHMYAHSTPLSLSTYIFHMWDVCMICIYVYIIYIYIIYIYRCINQALEKIIPSATFLLTITGDVDPRPLQVLLFDVAAGFGDLSLNLIGIIH